MSNNSSIRYIYYRNNVKERRKHTDNLDSFDPRPDTKHTFASLVARTSLRLLKTVNKGLDIFQESSPLVYHDQTERNTLESLRSFSLRAIFRENGSETSTHARKNTKNRRQSYACAHPSGDFRPSGVDRSYSDTLETVSRDIFLEDKPYQTQNFFKQIFTYLLNRFEGIFSTFIFFVCPSCLLYKTEQSFWKLIDEISLTIGLNCQQSNGNLATKTFSLQNRPWLGDMKRHKALVSDQSSLIFFEGVLTAKFPCRYPRRILFSRILSCRLFSRGKSCRKISEWSRFQDRRQGRLKLPDRSGLSSLRIITRRTGESGIKSTKRNIDKERKGEKKETGKGNVYCEYFYRAEFFSIDTLVY